jgi:glycyl-tRNA synthetase beta chain
MVGEFPELQGLMGGHYAREQGLPSEIANAIRDHYRPQGPNDEAPTDPATVVVALADKLDTLVSFFAIDERPTGSKDPYALRRAALGLIRILIENRQRVPLTQPLHLAHRILASQRTHHRVSDMAWRKYQAAKTLNLERYESAAMTATVRENVEPIQERLSDSKAVLAFLADRLKVLLKDQGKRHDLVDAVFALGDDDLVRIVARVEALDAFLTTDDGANLLAGYKRAVNILKAEEKKGALPTGTAARLPNAPVEETALLDALTAANPKVQAALDAEDFTAAMTALAALRAPVDAFFEKVLVNSEVPAERDNRLKLLGNVRDAMGRVADFSLISG